MKKHTGTVILLALGLNTLACATTPAPSPLAHVSEASTPQHLAAVGNQAGQPPHPHAVWAAGYYAYKDGRYVWVPGHWKY